MLAREIRKDRSIEIVATKLENLAMELDIRMMLQAHLCNNRNTRR